MGIHSTAQACPAMQRLHERWIGLWLKPMHIMKMQKAGCLPWRLPRRADTPVLLSLRSTVLVRL